MTFDEFIRVCAGNGVALDEGQRRCFTAFATSLAAWNEKVNLVSRKDLDNLWARHMLHSVAILFHARIAHDADVADIGTGGGFPGIPLKICRPDLSFVLMDSIAKKIAAVRDMLTTLQQTDPRMERISAVCGRAEAMAKLPAHRGAYDVVVARAVAPLVDLVGWSAPLLRPQGRLLALKGGALDAEIHALNKMFPRLHVSRQPLSVKGVPEFDTDEKQLIQIQW